MIGTRPRVSIVTPTFNSDRFLEQTIESVLSQQVRGLEHIVMDGGSTDGTHKILERYRPSLAKVVIGRDEGQYDAINKGLAASSGDVMTWLNSDDVYLPSMLNLVVTIFETFPQVEWLTTSKPIVIAETGEVVNIQNVLGFSREGFLRGENLPGVGWPGTIFIQQESTFWRRSLWEKIGGRIDLTYKLAGDFDLWARFFEHAELYALEVPVGCFRRHATQRSVLDFSGYIAEAKAILDRIGAKSGRPLLQKLSLLSRTPGLNLLRKPMLRYGCTAGLPVVAYDWGSQKWNLTRR
jgi:glycosyltransferase involved in cell wall biosynthesis